MVSGKVLRWSLCSSHQMWWVWNYLVYQNYSTEKLYNSASNSALNTEYWNLQCSPSFSNKPNSEYFSLPTLNTLWSPLVHILQNFFTWHKFWLGYLPVDAFQSCFQHVGCSKNWQGKEEVTSSLPSQGMPFKGGARQTVIYKLHMKHMS